MLPDFSNLHFRYLLSHVFNWLPFVLVVELVRLRALIPVVAVVKLRATKNVVRVVYFLGLILIGIEHAVSACREQ